jgi:hypothetical protein
MSDEESDANPRIESERIEPELTFRLIRNSKHDFSARVMCGGLLLRRDRFTQRQNLRHDRLDFSRVDQVRNLREVCCIRMTRDRCSVNTPLLELGPIGERH